MPVILDTNVLIQWWRKESLGAKGDAAIAAAARQLSQRYRNGGIVWIVRLEFLAGVTSVEECKKALVYLNRFQLLDAELSSSDWREAERIAKRIPPGKKRRQATDCLIRALAKRLNCDVVSFENWDRRPDTGSLE